MMIQKFQNLIQTIFNIDKIVLSEQYKAATKILKALNPDHFDIIRWSEGGFVIWNVEQMKKQLLPQYFKHNNFSSLMRQLNKYGFKIKSKEDEKAYFIHPTIRQNNREIKRAFNDKKISINQEIEKELDFLNQELKSIKARQYLLNKQMQISVKLMLKLQKYYENLVKTAYQSVTFTYNFGNLMLSNQRKIFGQVDGDLFKVQQFYLLKHIVLFSLFDQYIVLLNINQCIKSTNQFAFNIIIQAFPNQLISQNLTPAISGNITPLPFYFNNKVNDETKNRNPD